MTDSRPIAEGLFTWPSDEPHLIGSRCDACGLVVFPTAGFCVKCSQQRLSDIELGRRGTLWTFTTQQFRPPSPPYVGDESFEPFALGYVAIDGQCMVEARLTEADPEKLRIGQEMELQIIPVRTDDSGRTVVTFAFAPVD